MRGVAAPANDLAAEIARARADPRRSFGNFLLLGELGRGGMGVVYRAWHDGLKKVVAVKTILSQEATPEGVQRFHREAEAVARLRHPNIVAVHDVGQVGGTHYLVMDFIEGATLDRRLKEKGPRRLPLQRAVGIVRDVARAVHYAHEQGVIHRDLKPQNIMLDASDRPLVLDFGLARIAGMGSLTKTGATMGTIAYMPPEQAGEMKKTDERSDVYSLGATLYHVLAGRGPFEGDMAGSLGALLTQRAPLPSTLARDVPAKLETIAMRCLEKEPEKRYPTAAALALDLDLYLAEKPLAGRGGSSPLAMLAVAIAVLAVSGGLWLAFPEEKPGKTTEPPPPPPVVNNAAGSGKTTKPPVEALPKLFARKTLPAGLVNDASLDPEIRRLLVSGGQYGESRTLVVRTDDLSVVRTLDVVAAVFDTTTHRFFAVHHSERYAAAFDGTTLEQVWKTPLPEAIPCFLAVDPGKRRLYVGNQGGAGSDPVNALDLASGEPIGPSVRMGGTCGQLRVDPATHRIFAYREQDMVVLRPTERGVEIEKVMSDVGPLSVDAERSRIFLARGSPMQIVVMSTKTLDFAETGLPFPTSYPFDLDARGGRYYTRLGSGEVVSLDRDTLGVKGRFALDDGFVPYATSLDDASRKLYFIGWKSQTRETELFVYSLPK